MNPTDLDARPWLASYPAGVPAEVDGHDCPTLKARLERSCDLFAERPAFSCLGVTINYARLGALTRDFAAWMQQRAGLRKGDRVAVMLPNMLQHPVAVFGSLRAGLAVVNVNPMYTAVELRHQLIDSGARAIVVLENFAHTVEQALPGTMIEQVIVTRFGDLFPMTKGWLVNFALKFVKHAVPAWNLPTAVSMKEVLDDGSGLALEDADVVADDMAFLQYTGGTTGRPKGAVLTHANLVANVEQVAAWAHGTLKEGEETVITALPLYHVFALTTNLLLFLRLGGHNVLIPDARDLPHLMAELESVPFTAIVGVNTLFAALMSAPGFARMAALHRDRVKVAVAGGMALQPDVSDRWQAHIGRPIIEGYGLTEASPIVCANPLDADRASGKLGLPLPSTEVRIVDEAGQPVPLGVAGEIAVRGPQVMPRYWNMPEETRQVIDAQGWLRTGDIGRMAADGYVEFVDRKKDVIVVSGLKAFPTEVEDVVRLHPGVADAAAVGVADPHSGEAVMLFVVRKDPTLDEESVREHCEARLAAYKRPKRIEFRDALPRTQIGKVLRRQLKEEAMTGKAAPGQRRLAENA